MFPKPVEILKFFPIKFKFSLLKLFLNSLTLTFKLLDLFLLRMNKNILLVKYLGKRRIVHNPILLIILGLIISTILFLIGRLGAQALPGAPLLNNTDNIQIDVLIFEQ